MSELPALRIGQRLLHRGVGEPFAVDGDGVALLGDVAALAKERSAVSLASTVRLLAPRAPPVFPAHRTSIEPRPARTLGCTKSMSIWSAPFSEAKPTGEFWMVAISVSCPASFLPNASSSSAARPGFLLRLAVIVAGQLLDRGNEDRRQHRTSAGRNGRKPGLGNACPIASKHSEQSQGQHDRGNDQRPFDEDVVAPVLWERRIGLCHRAISQWSRFRRHPCRP
jgi:hypothetical protein